MIEPVKMLPKKKANSSMNPKKQAVASETQALIDTTMWEAYLKRYWFLFIICYVLLLHIFMFTSPLLKLLRQTSPLAVLTGILTLLLGLLGYVVFQWFQKISSKRLTLSISAATSFAEEAGDDPYPTHTNYEVFISFRGKDTRDNFTSHLYEALSRKKIKTFMDDRINRGDEISSTLTRTIRRSEIYVIVFSKDYASSSWCLDELIEILKCKKRYQRLVIPIFYNVDPSNVRRQTGSYADSFVKHMRRCKNDMNKLNKWKTALIQASNLSGLDSATTRPEPLLIGKVVEDIFRKLKRNCSYDLEGLIGIHDHISAVESLLNIGSQDVRIVGLWGMGGIGKTTIADAIFHMLQPQFESSSFVSSVQDKLTRAGIDRVRDRYLQELLEEEDIGAHSFRSLFVKKLLQRKKILLVLDDVEKSTQVEALIKKRDWFGSGSRIIITTRDMQVLRNADADGIYHVEGMSFDDALQLFSLKTFKQDLPIKDYMILSKEAVNYCDGIPLALNVLGSFLYRRTKPEWESALKRLQQAPQKEISEVYKLSFEKLEDDEKEIFLDIAIFHNGMFAHDVKDILGSCGFFAEIGMRVLMDRALISIRHRLVVMHDLIKAMGREIQSRDFKSRKGRRLWKHEDIYHLLKTKNKGTKRIHGISLDLSKIEEIYLKPDVFENMYELEILKFYNPLGHSHRSCRLFILNGLKNLPEELRIFQWQEYPHTFVPLDSCAKHLVEVNMRYSGVKQLWDSNQHLPNLKNLDLIGSKQLVGIPDLSATPNIRHINVIGCTGLSQIFSSGFLRNLEFMSVSGCESLKTVNFGGNNVHRRRWRLLAVYEFFTLARYIFSKVTMKISKSKCNTYNVQFSFASVPVTGSSSKSMNCDSESAMLTSLYGTLKSFLPNLELIRLFDNPSSLETLSKLVYLQLSSLSAGTPKISVMMRTTRELFGPTENLCSPCKKRTGIKEIVSSWDDLIDLDEKLTGSRVCICDYRLSKINLNIFHWSCLTQVSLHRSDIVTVAASIHGSSSLNSLLLCDSTRPTFAVDLTFSMDAQIPQSVSEISLNLAEQQLKIDHYLFIHFLNNGLNKCFHCGNTRPNVEGWSPFPVNLFLDLYPKPLPNVKF